MTIIKRAFEVELVSVCAKSDCAEGTYNTIGYGKDYVYTYVYKYRSGFVLGKDGESLRFVSFSSFFVMVSQLDVNSVTSY
jgi:hypothetical protein